MIYGFIKTKLDGTEKVFGASNTKLPDSFKYKLPPVLNQGDKPTCVACATSAWINWYKNSLTGNATYDNNVDIMKIFNGGKGTAEGMYVKNAFVYLKQQKLIRSYALVKSEAALKYALYLNGVCIGALPVCNPYSTQFWAGTTYQGGHAIAITGWTNQGFVIRNSWGKSYGLDGYGIIPYSSFNKFTEIWTLIN